MKEPIFEIKDGIAYCKDCPYLEDGYCSLVEDRLDYYDGFLTKCVPAGVPIFDRDRKHS